MRARGLIPIILLNVIISLVVAFGAIAIFNRNATSPVNERLVTLEIIITATPDPNATPFVITATAQPGDPQTVDIPSDALASAGVTPGTRMTAFRDSGENTTDENDSPTGSALTINDDLPPGCIKHTIVSGDSPSGLAVAYGVNLFDLMAANNLTEESARLLAIDQVLVIPLDGCPIELFIVEQASPTPTPTETGEASNTPQATNTPRVTNTPATSNTPQVTETAEFSPTPTSPPTNTPMPTVTLAPTQVNSQIQITQVIGAGDITREGLEILNNGISTDISGWSIVDLDGNTFTFSDFLLFENGSITISTRTGENRHTHLFWGLDSAIFEPGDVISLLDRNKNVQATFRVP
jgi:LysM repeat protein